MTKFFDDEELHGLAEAIQETNRKSYSATPSEFKQQLRDGYEAFESALESTNIRTPKYKNLFETDAIERKEQLDYLNSLENIASLDFKVELNESYQ